MLGAIIVAVGSQNPMKINVSQEVFEDTFKDIDIFITGHEVDSQVSKQPKSEQETILGAYNRVKAVQLTDPNATFWVAQESGLIRTIYGYCNVCYVMIFSRHGICTYAKSSEFHIPENVSKLIDEGIELSDACDQIFGTKEIGKSGGIISVLTENFIDRTDYYIQPMMFALLPHKLDKQYNADKIWTEENLKKILKL